MSITLSIAPDVVQDVRLYAEQHGTSLNQLVRDYLEAKAQEVRSAREKESKEVFDFLMSQKGSFKDGWKFSREEANERKP